MSYYHTSYQFNATELFRRVLVLKLYEGYQTLDKQLGTGSVLKKENCEENILNFASHDYLDYANSGVVKNAVFETVLQQGLSATGSRMTCGNLEVHEDLENTIAHWVGGEKCLLFASGYQANVGLLTALGDPVCHFLVDELSTSSLIDGAKYSGRKSETYKHCDLEDLERLLKAAREGSKVLAIYVATESMFGTNGRLAPLVEIFALCSKYNANLIVDESHTIGLYGSKGGGYCQQIGVSPFAITCSLATTVGCMGGFVVCEDLLRRYLINYSNAFKHSTALSPVAVAGSRAVIEDINLIMQDIHRPLGIWLRRLADIFCTELKKNGTVFVASEGQIISINIGNNADVIQLKDELREEGILVDGLIGNVKNISLRFAITKAHREEDLVYAAQVVSRLVKALADKNAKERSRKIEAGEALNSHTPKFCFTD